MLVQKTVTTNTNFAGRLSEWMLRKTPPDSKSGATKTPDFTPSNGNKLPQAGGVGRSSQSD
jgi:hypothetical protein